MPYTFSLYATGVVIKRPPHTFCRIVQIECVRTAREICSPPTKNNNNNKGHNDCPSPHPKTKKKRNRK